MTEAERLARILERPGYGWHTTPAEAAAELRRLSAELDEVRADRDSWAQQASDRAGEAVAAIEELEALKKAISEAEPVAHIRKNGFRFLGEIEPQDDSETALYTLKGIK